jgi:acetoin utilization protein AcuB
VSDDPRFVARWMSKDLETTTPAAALEDALEKMERRRIRHLPVIDEEKLVGLLSDRDTRRCLGGEGDAVLVRDVMTPYPKLRCVERGTLVRDAAEVICREKISSLPVVAGEQLVGIVTSEDLLWAFLEIPE